MSCKNLSPGCTVNWIDPCCDKDTTPSSPCSINFLVDVSYFCNKTTTASIVSVTGGNPPYEYSIDGVNYSNNSNFSNLSDGTYTFYVRDNAGCIKEVTLNIAVPPEYDDTYWFSLDGDKLTGQNNNIDVFHCLGNSNYLIKTSQNDPAYFDFTSAYTTFYPLVDGVTYNIEIVVPIVSGLNPRIFVEENAVNIYDTGFGISSGTYSFSFTYNTGDDLKIWFDKSGGGIATFQLITFNIT